MVGCNVSFKHHLMRSIVLAVILMLVLAVPVFALEAEASLPRIDKWVNGMAVSDDGTYLADTWAVDESGLSERMYVLLDQGCMEVMRVENYPDGVENGDTTPLAKSFVTISLVLPEAATGDVVVTLVNDVAEYSVFFSESEEHRAYIDLYPGVYEITDVEITGDVNGVYEVTNYSQLDTAASESVSFEIAASEKSGAGDDAGALDGSDNSGNGAAGDGKESDLLENTFLLVVVVVFLCLILVAIKYRRQKSEEMKR